MFSKKSIKNKNTLMKIIVTVIMIFVFVFWMLVYYVFEKEDSIETNIFKSEDLQNITKEISETVSDTVNDLSKNKKIIENNKE